MSIEWKPTSNRTAGKEWEALCASVFDRLERDDQATAGKYGVMAWLNPKDRTWSVRPSNPDIEGVLKGGRQFIFDCKAVTSSPSLPIGKLRDERKKQLTHMLRRSRLGAICFFCVYFGEWSTSKDFMPASTWALPVWEGHELWSSFEEGSVSMVSRLAMSEYAVPIQWIRPKRCVNYVPDLLSAIQQVAVMLDSRVAVLDAASKEVPNGEEEDASTDGNGRRGSRSTTSHRSGEGRRVRESAQDATAESGERERAPF